MNNPFEELFLASASASASRIDPSRLPIPAPTKIRSYTPVQIDKRKLKEHGDPLEKAAYDDLKHLFPSYEELWKVLIWDITDRGYSNPDFQPRRDCPSEFVGFAEAHYTFFRSFIFGAKLLKVHSLGKGHDLEPFYTNERFLGFYSHLGRIRDMCCLMLERFEMATGATAFRAEGEYEFPLAKVVECLKSKVRAGCGNQFHGWFSEITQYRNLLHRTAHAVVYSDDKALVIRPNLIKGSTGWQETLNRPSSDFIGLEEIMQKHWGGLIGWATPLWGYFIAQAKAWRAEEGRFEKMLRLPTAGGR